MCDEQECLYITSQMKAGELNGVALMGWVGKDLSGEQNAQTGFSFTSMLIHLDFLHLNTND